MAVRNFWIDANIDGRQTELSGGPRAKDGGMTVTLKQRNKGAIVEAVRLECYERDGYLNTLVYVGGNLVPHYFTKR